MTQQLYLAANLVPETLIYGHLQIVYEDSAGNLLENETTSPGFPYFFGDWAYPAFGRPHDNTTNTPGYGNPNDYAIVSLSLRPEQTAEHVWELMAQIHASLSTGGHGLDYDIGQNSNSYAASVLSVIGIDIAAYLAAVLPPDVSGFPGVGANIFQGAKTGGLFSGYDTPIPLTLAGTAGNDYIVTGIGNDSLGGAAGNDEIHAGGGKDVVDGGTGNDRLFGGAGNDTLLGGAGFDWLEGGADDDHLDGGAQADNLLGGAGNDLMLGGGGFDRLFGGDDNDRGYGGDGTDALFGQEGNDSLYGEAGNDRFFGGTGNDLVDGGADNDTIFGGAGFDTIIGGAGNDELSGNFNADTFVFSDGFGIDAITDFAATNNFEKIDLSAVTSITDFTDLKDNHMSQVGSDVVIDALGGNTITLLGVSLGDLLDGNDFIF